MSFINHNITPPAEVVIVTEQIAVYERANLNMSTTHPFMLLPHVNTVWSMFSDNIRGNRGKKHERLNIHG